MDLNVFGKNLWVYGPLPKGDENADAKVATAIDAYFKKVPPATAPQVERQVGQRRGQTLRRRRASRFRLPVPRVPER